MAGASWGGARGEELYSRSLDNLSSCVPMQGERSVLGIRLDHDHEKALRDVLGLALEDCDVKDRSLPDQVTDMGLVVEIGVNLEGGR